MLLRLYQKHLPDASLSVLMISHGKTTEWLSECMAKRNESNPNFEYDASNKTFWYWEPDINTGQTEAALYIAKTNLHFLPNDSKQQTIYLLQCAAWNNAKLITSADKREDLERSASILGRIPAGRWGEPQDFKGPAVFLASQASDYVHGTILTVDGGWMGR